MGHIQSCDNAFLSFDPDGETFSCIKRSYESPYTCTAIRTSEIAGTWRVIEQKLDRPPRLVLEITDYLGKSVRTVMEVGPGPLRQVRFRPDPFGAPSEMWYNFSLAEK